MARHFTILVQLKSTPFFGRGCVKAAKEGKIQKIMDRRGFIQGGALGLASALFGVGAAFALPPEGLYFGSASYGGERNRTVLGPNHTGHAHSRWTGARPTPFEQIRITKEEGYGNCLQFWQGGEYLADLVEAAAKAGVWTFNIYSDADAASVKRIGAVGDWWLGHDSGEIFHYDEKDCGDKENPTLQDVADGFMRRVRDYVAKRRAAGWGTIMSTGADFSMDYQVAAGITFPCTEDMPFRNLLVSSALERGVCRQFGLPLWGSHNAHEWNAFLPVSNPLRMPLLYAGFELKYMTGAKLIVNESGNWEAQSVLCEDSPEHDLPHLAMGEPGIHAVSMKDVEALMPEARRHADKIGYESAWCRGYRAEMKRFWAFVKANPAPQGQPQASFAIAKGNLDLCDEKNNPNIPVGGAQRLADRNVNWYPGQPEESWDIVFDAYYPRPSDVLAPNRNPFLAGTPYGLCDITSFADDRASADFLLRNYKAVVFAGWNSCTKKQYGVLCDYVKGGGRLVIALPHLSTDVTRNYRNFTREDLVNGGDFTELCGLKVRGRNPTRVWWVTAAEPDRSKVNCLGIRWPRRYGIMGMFLGDLEFTGPASDYELLAVDDEAARPVIVRCKRGKGEVFFVSTWCYPAGAEKDEGPGDRLGSDGLMTTLYKYVASISRGDVYIAAKGGDLPDDECRYVICSYFPEAGKTYLKNIDFRRNHTIDLKAFGKVTTVTLAPAEMRIIGTK